MEVEVYEPNPLAPIMFNVNVIRWWKEAYESIELERYRCKARLFDDTLPWRFRKCDIVVCREDYKISDYEEMAALQRDRGFNNARKDIAVVINEVKAIMQERNSGIVRPQIVAVIGGADRLDQPFGGVVVEEKIDRYAVGLWHSKKGFIREVVSQDTLELNERKLK